MQTSLTSKPRQAKHPAPPTGRNLHNKKEPQTTRIQKGHPKPSNLNKMKRQRNTQQVKEHEKCPPSRTKEEEIGNLPEKEFRIMIIKMIQNLENKMKSRIWKFGVQVLSPNHILVDFGLLNCNMGPLVFSPVLWGVWGLDNACRCSWSNANQSSGVG